MKVKEIIRYTEWIPNPKRAVETPKFSIMLPTYRRFASGHLTRAIQSVLSQSYKEFELIIIDDGSVDGSFDEIQRFMKLDPRVHCLHHPRNVGLPAIGCYEAYQKSQGEYLMFCFDDTEYQPGALEKVAEYTAVQKPRIAFGYIDYPYMDANGAVVQTYLGKDKISQSVLQIINVLPNLGAILHRDVPSELGFLDPHVALVRLTDWDYWRRAAKVLQLHFSDIHIGTEFGLMTGNSLGLTNPINLWMTSEWMERERDQALTPGKYEEFDVQKIPEELSDQSKLTLQEMSRFYENKFWYSPQGEIKLSNHLSSEDHERNAKILVLTGANDASVSLYFEYIPEIRKNVRIVSPYYFDLQELINASALIISRHLFLSETRRWVQAARQLGIPHYYYLDDNFTILKSELLEYKRYTIENLKKELVTYKGVLVSTQALADYFTEHNIHPSIYTFPPIAPPQRWLDSSLIPKKPAKTIRIGFLGGPHRHKEFRRDVLPAITRLAEEQALELVIGGDLKISTEQYPQLRIYQYPFDLSYRLALGHMQSADIDILVHAGSITLNNPFKSLNVLLNAWVLKAFPILANQPPYEDVEKLGLGLVCKDSDEWYKNLCRVVSQSELVSQVRENLSLYISESLSGKKNLEVLKAVAQECPSPGFSEIDRRYKLYVEIVKSSVPQAIGSGLNILRQNSRFEAFVRRHRSWLLPTGSPQERFARFIFRKFFSRRSAGIASNNALMAQGTVRLINTLKYRLRPSEPQWNGFEFIIGTHQRRAAGEIVVEITDQAIGNVVRQKTLDLNELEDNQLVQVDFEMIPNSKDKDFVVQFLLLNPSPETLISIYEQNATESRLRRILRRQGWLSRGNTLACRLLYAEE
jgi:glycosyltransferase involved in cell wall biosynthesis